MNKTIDFQWELTEENFRRMMAEEQTPDIFGAARFGEYLVEFRCTGGGFDDDYHVPTTDVYQYGEEGVEEYALANGVPYKLLDEEFVIPKRRSLEGFKRSFEAEVLDRITGSATEITEASATAATLSHAAWNPQKKEKMPNSVVTKVDELRIPTQLGTIVVGDKGYDENSGYPGVWIGIERGEKLFDVAMVEVDQDYDDDEEPLLKCHVYCTDPLHDDPIYQYATDAHDIDRFLNSEK